MLATGCGSVCVMIFLMHFDPEFYVAFVSEESYLKRNNVSVIVRLNLLPSTNISGRVLNQVHVGELDEIRFHLYMLQIACS